jgi:universal stress protein E
MSELRGPVIIASDLSERSTQTLLAGVALARQLETSWSVCHVVPEAFRVRVLFPHEAGIGPDSQREISARAVLALSSQIEAALGRQADPSEIQIETGTPHTGVLQAAARQGAALIVMSPGATATRVTRAAKVPVLLIREGNDGAVLGATDFSDPSLPALNMAISEARRRKAPLRFVHCLDIDASAYLAAAGAPGAMAAVPFPESVVASLESEARQQLANAAGDSGAEIVVLRYSPSAGILHEASQTPTALIVVGTHGRSGLVRLALGSVAEHVMSHAPCSVLVVPLHRD